MGNTVKEAYVRLAEVVRADGSPYGESDWRHGCVGDVGLLTVSAFGSLEDEVFCFVHFAPDAEADEDAYKGSLCSTFGRGCDVAGGYLFASRNTVYRFSDLGACERNRCKAAMDAFDARLSKLLDQA